MEPIQDWAAARPAPALRGLVASYQGYRQAGLAPARHTGLPSPHLTLILTLDEPLTVAVHPRREQAPASYTSLLGGLHTAPAIITHDGAQSGVQVALHPAAARPLLGLPAGELAGDDVAAADVVGPWADGLREALLAASTWQRRFAVLDRLLLQRLQAQGQDAAGAPPAEVLHAWQRLRATGGRVSVGELVAETGWSGRHLRVMMRRETGLGPKTAARVMRFDRARRAVARRRSCLADVAAATGYADQSHLDRDFRAFAGAPPSRWLAEEVRNVQVPPPDQLAVSTA